MRETWSCLENVEPQKVDGASPKSHKSTGRQSFSPSFSLFRFVREIREEIFVYFCMFWMVLLTPGSESFALTRRWWYVCGESHEEDIIITCWERVALFLSSSIKLGSIWIWIIRQLINYRKCLGTKVLKTPHSDPKSIKKRWDDRNLECNTIFSKEISTFYQRCKMMFEVRCMICCHLKVYWCALHECWRVES